MGGPSMKFEDFQDFPDFGLFLLFQDSRNLRLKDLGSIEALKKHSWFAFSGC